MATIGVFGAGRVGMAIGRAALAAGDEVRLTGTSDAATQQMLFDIVAPGLTAATPAEVAASDLVVIAVPLPKFRAIDPAPLAGRIVIDAMNYWSGTDGQLDEFADALTSSSSVVAEHFADSRVVKTFNHVGYRDLDVEPVARRNAAGDRVGLGIAGDDADAVDAVAAFVTRLGFDAVPVGSLDAGRILEPGGPVFGGLLSADDLARELTLARVAR